MPRQPRWLSVALIAILAVGGWVGLQQIRWRDLYYAHATAHLIYDVNMAHRALVRASRTSDYGEKREAMANAESYMVSAHYGSIGLLNRMAPPRKGHPTYMPANYIPAVFQYVRQLTPDLSDAEVQNRVVLLDGLEKTLKSGQTKTWLPQTQAFRVDVPALKESLDRYFRALPKGDDPGMFLEFGDQPNKHTVTASRQQHGVDVRVQWARTWKLFPRTPAGYFVMVRPGAGVEVTSDVGQQPRMGGDPLAPFDFVEWSAELHEGFRRFLPPDWVHGSFAILRIPEGLPQTLTIRLPDGGLPSLLLFRPGSNDPAVPITVAAGS